MPTFANRSNTLELLALEADRGSFQLVVDFFGATERGLREPTFFDESTRHFPIMCNGSF